MKILNEITSRLLKFVLENKKISLIALIIIFFTIFLFFYNKAFIILLLIAIGALSLIHTIFTRNFIGFELCTLVTIIASMQYGLTVGVITGVTSITLGLILGRNVDGGIIISIIGFVLIAVAASFFTFKEIVFIGIALTIVYDILLVAFYFFTGSNPFTLISYFVTHIIFNYLIFVSIAPIFISLVT